MKGIVLAGGMGSRLYPLTQVVNKHLQAVHDKPMIYYPLTTLIECGVRDLCLISTPTDLPHFERLLGNGSAWGVSIEFRAQARPAGIAEAFLIARSFIGEDKVALILGDNIFCSHKSIRKAFMEFEDGGLVFGYEVPDPTRYGVVECDHDGRPISLEEKPAFPKSRWAIPGVYLYDHHVVSVVERLQPSPRGELEITDVNVVLLMQGKLAVSLLEADAVWLDAGTPDSLYQASVYVQTIQRLKGVKVGCPEVAAYRNKFISSRQLDQIACRLPECEYRDHLRSVAKASEG